MQIILIILTFQKIHLLDTTFFEICVVQLSLLVLIHT